MKLHEYEPKLRKNPVMILAAAAMTAGDIALWVFRRQLKLSKADMIMLTGIVLIIILLTVRDCFRKKEYYDRACELRKQREDMANEDFSDSGIFFK